MRWEIGNRKSETDKNPAQQTNSSWCYGWKSNRLKSDKLKSICANRAKNGVSIPGFNANIWITYNVYLCAYYVVCVSCVYRLSSILFSLFFQSMSANAFNAGFTSFSSDVCAFKASTRQNVHHTFPYAQAHMHTHEARKLQTDEANKIPFCRIFASSRRFLPPRTQTAYLSFITASTDLYIE